MRALVAAVEDGSLRSAARRLGISQPALTKAIRELERELATSLLTRTSTGVTATAQGKVLFEHARAADLALSAAVNQIRQLGGEMVGDLSVAAVPLAVMMLIPETLRTFSREFPQIRLRIHEELYIEQLSRLRKGEVDVAIGPLPAGIPSGELIIEPLMPISMVVVVGKGNPLARAVTRRAGARALGLHRHQRRPGLRQPPLRAALPAAAARRCAGELDAVAAVADLRRRLRRPDAAADRGALAGGRVHGDGASARRAAGGVAGGDVAAAERAVAGGAALRGASGAGGASHGQERGVILNKEPRPYSFATPGTWSHRRTRAWCRRRAVAGVEGSAS